MSDEQLDLTRPGVGRHQALPRDTALDAARAVGPKLGGQRRLVLDAFEAAGARGLTDEELRAMTGVKRARTRRQELIEDHGLPIRDSGRRRKVLSGQTAIVWELGEHAPISDEENLKAALATLEKLR